MERYNLIPAEREALGNSLRVTCQGDLSAVWLKSVKGGAIKRGKSFELIQRIFLVEGIGVAFNGVGGVENPGAAAGTFFRADRMRGRVRAKEELRMARCGRFTQSEAVPLTLGDGQAIKMRADAALEDGVAVKIKMMRRNRRPDIGRAFRDKFRRLLRGDMFKHDF